MGGENFYDVVIVGAGPAGCMAALGAKQADPSARVLLIAKDSVAPHRIGEALLTGTILTFEEAGIADEIAAQGYHRKIGAAYVWGKDRAPWYVNYPEHDPAMPYPEAFVHEGRRVTIHVPREKFDQTLRDICMRRGIEIMLGKAVDVTATDSKVILSLTLESGAVVRGRYFIDASGQLAFLGRKLSERTPVWNTRVARYAYFRNVDWKRAIDEGFDPHRTNILSDSEGWNWVIHLGEKSGGLTSIGFVTTPDVANKLDFERCVEAFSGLKLFGYDKGLTEPLDHLGNPMGRFYGHPDYSYQTTDLDGPNWALAGDAALFIDPILSQGVTLACHFGLQRGRAAIEHLNGDTDAAKRVTKHYRNESAVLRVVVGEWYANNKSVPTWKWKASEISKELGIPGAEKTFDAFRYITNLENLRDEYDPFDKETRQHIFAHLTE